MTFWNVFTMVVTLGALVAAAYAELNSRRRIKDALQAMRDLVAEFARSETEETRQDIREQKIRTLVSSLQLRVDNHSTRLNDLEDMVDLLNHDGTTPIPSDVEVTSEFLEDLESERVMNGVDLEDTQELPLVLPIDTTEAIGQGELMRMALEVTVNPVLQQSIRKYQEDDSHRNQLRAQIEDLGVTTVVTDEPFGDIGEPHSMERGSFLLRVLDPSTAAYAACVRMHAQILHGGAPVRTVDWYLGEQSVVWGSEVAPRYTDG